MFELTVEAAYRSNNVDTEVRHVALVRWHCDAGPQPTAFPFKKSVGQQEFSALSYDCQQIQYQVIFVTV